MIIALNPKQPNGGPGKGGMVNRTETYIFRRNGNITSPEGDI